jgi:hypothetical protein
VPEVIDSRWARIECVDVGALRGSSDREIPQTATQIENLARKEWQDRLLKRIQ